VTGKQGTGAEDGGAASDHGMPGGSRRGPRLPYLDDRQLAASEAHRATTAAIRARRAAGALLNLDRMLLHSLPFAQGWNALLGAIRRQLALDPLLRELAICAVARLNQAPYEWLQHVGEWRAAGARADQVAALAGPDSHWSADPAFAADERTVLELTATMTRCVAVPEDLMARVAARFGETVTVELVGTIAAYNMVSRFLVALGVDAEGESEGEGLSPP
jgi:alkylhydroperoxidase family enzyme